MSILIIPVVLCAAYLVMVSVSVCDRMTAETNHLIRILVAAIGGVGFWALCKSVAFGWGSTTEELIQGLAIVGLALLLGFMPRIKTDRRQRSMGSRNFGQRN